MFGGNQRKLREALEKAYVEGVDSWDAQALRRLAAETLSGKGRSTLQSAIKGMTTHGVLTLVDGKHFLAQPPKRPSDPARAEGVQGQPEGRG